MAQELPLDPAVIAMVSLAANIAANHPKKGLCQIERLRGYGISDEQIDMVVDIARHLRDEAGEMLDAAFNEEAGLKAAPQPCCAPAAAPTAQACCTPTAKGNPCC